ncbi:hypothetical protein PZA11_002197 [Diplocarpon coronariae]
MLTGADQGVTLFIAYTEYALSRSRTGYQLGYNLYIVIIRYITPPFEKSLSLSVQL